MTKEKKEVLSSKKNLAVKHSTLKVQGVEVHLLEKDNKDYISLTDMTTNFAGGSSLIEAWLRNKNTIEFLGVWEKINNPNFSHENYKALMKDAGNNWFFLSAKTWLEKTNGIGLLAKTGRHDSGTFAHKDIAFEFGSWLSPEFKLKILQSISTLKTSSSNSFIALFQKTLPSYDTEINTYSVYLMHDNVNNFYKIGSSRSPHYREKTLQAEKPSIVLLAYKSLGNKKDAKQLEKSLHEQYTSNRIRGEWFKLSELEILEITTCLE